MGTSLPKSSRWDPKNVGQGTLLPSPKQAQYLTIDYQNLGETLRRLALALWASWALTRRQMTRVRRRLVIHHTQDSRIHGVHAHHGRQLQQTLLAVTRPHGVERVVADLRRLQQLPPEAKGKRLVCRQAVQRAVRVDGVERLLAHAGLQAQPYVPVPDVVGVGRPRRGADRQFRLRPGQRRMVAQVVDEVGEQRPSLPGVREVAARRWHTVARLKDVAHSGARLLGKRLRIGRNWQSRHLILLHLASFGIY